MPPSVAATHRLSSSPVTVPPAAPAPAAPQQLTDWGKFTSGNWYAQAEAGTHDNGIKAAADFRFEVPFNTKNAAAFGVITLAEYKGGFGHPDTKTVTGDTVAKSALEVRSIYTENQHVLVLPKELAVYLKSGGRDFQLSGYVGWMDPFRRFMTRYDGAIRDTDEGFGADRPTPNAGPGPVLAFTFLAEDNDGNNSDWRLGGGVGSGRKQLGLLGFRAIGGDKPDFCWVDPVGGDADSNQCHNLKPNIDGYSIFLFGEFQHNIDDKNYFLVHGALFVNQLPVVDEATKQSVDVHAVSPELGLSARIGAVTLFFDTNWVVDPDREEQKVSSTSQRFEFRYTSPSLPVGDGSVKFIPNIRYNHVGSRPGSFFDDEGRLSSINDETFVSDGGGSEGSAEPVRIPLSNSGHSLTAGLAVPIRLWQVGPTEKPNQSIDFIPHLDFGWHKSSLAAPKDSGIFNIGLRLRHSF